MLATSDRTDKDRQARISYLGDSAIGETRTPATSGDKMTLDDTRLSRRKFLGAGAAAVAVVAWDINTGSWLTAADAAVDRSTATPIPPQLAGKLVTDEAALAAAADDFGHIVSRLPRAVLQATSAEDISTLIKWANKVGIKVAARGQAHSVFGEGQVADGVVIDMNGLNTIHELGDDFAVVDAGVTWEQVLEQSIPIGLAPPVLTDYVRLSIGGVLAVGGIGGNMNQAGMVIDNVDSIDVVTGNGQLVRNVSARRKADLFEAALGGLGQVAIITKARIRLAPVTALVRVYELTYTDAGAYLDDQRTLVADGRFGYHEGQIVSDGAGGWNFKIEVGAYYNPPEVPDDAVLLAGLSPDGGQVISDLPSEIWFSRVSFAEAQLRQIGLWDTPHPWSDLFVDDASAEQYVTETVLPTLTAEGVGAGLLLLYPFRTDRLTRPMARVPEGDVVWAFDILRFPFDPTLTDALMAENRLLFEGAAALGGNFYPIGALDTTADEWVAYFGPLYDTLLANKRRYDPADVLTPGQGI